MLAHEFTDDFSAEALFELVDSEQRGIGCAVIPPAEIENFQTGSLVMHHGFPNEQAIGATDFSLSFLAGSVGVERSRMETANPLAFAIEDMISLAFTGGRISGPD